MKKKTEEGKMDIGIYLNDSTSDKNDFEGIGINFEEIKTVEDIKPKKIKKK